MSIRLMTRAWDLDLPASEKLALLCLCDHANDDGQCWPSIERMTQRCGVHRATVFRILRRLESAGLIRRENRQNTTSVFRITLESKPCDCSGFGVANCDGVGVAQCDGGGRTVRRLGVAQCDPNHHRTTNEPSNTRAGASASDDLIDERDATETTARADNPEAHPPLPPPPAPGSFEDWWAAYPRKEGKKAALRAYRAAVKAGADPDVLLEALKRRVAFWRRERIESRFIPLPATWLNQGRWEDVVPGSEPVVRKDFEPLPVPPRLCKGCEQPLPDHAPDCPVVAARQKPKVDGLW